MSTPTSAASAITNLLTGIDGLRGGRTVPGAAPAEAEEEARLAARLGVELPPLLQTYRVGHAVVWEYFLAEVERLDLDPGARRDALQLGSRYLFSYIDAVIPVVTDTYTRERDRLFRSSGEQRRARLVRDILDGADDEGGELGYDTHGEHIGALAWGERPEEALRELAAELDRPLLLVSFAEEVVWAWISAAGVSPRDWNRILRFDPGRGTQLALGSVGSDLEGFRRTHREAQRTYLAARRGQTPVTRFADVTVEALALADELAARES